MTSNEVIKVLAMCSRSSVCLFIHLYIHSYPIVNLSSDKRFSFNRTLNKVPTNTLVCEVFSKEWLIASLTNTCSKLGDSISETHSTASCYKLESVKTLNKNILYVTLKSWFCTSSSTIVGVFRSIVASSSLSTDFLGCWTDEWNKNEI